MQIGCEKRGTLVVPRFFRHYCTRSSTVLLATATIICCCSGRTLDEGEIIEMMDETIALAMLPGVHYNYSLSEKSGLCF